jgi:hypothetical protein
VLRPNSALAANGNLCSAALVMPTTITAQNGAQIRQNTKISVAGCGIRILRRKIVGHTVRSESQGGIQLGGLDHGHLQAIAGVGEPAVPRPRLADRAFV